MLENNLIIIRDDVTDENVLAVLAALQAFEASAIDKNKAWNKIHHDKRILEFNTYIVCPTSYTFIFEKCLSTVKYINPRVYPKLAYTYVCEISIARARTISDNTDKPLALAIGILLGCESSTLADVSNLCTEYVIKYDLAADIALSTFLMVEKMQFYSTTVATLEEKIDIVFKSKVIVGYSSFETYLGCCLRKPVVEIQKDPSLYKWSNPNYICITEEVNLHELVPKGISQCLLMDIKG